jgi:hypothetical protein
MQLSIFDLTPDPTPTRLRYPDPRKARKLRELADSLQSQIDKKLDPAIGHQRPTRRRAGIVASMREDGKRLQQIQFWLRAMADEAETGTLADILGQITAKTQLEVLHSFCYHRWRDEAINRILADRTGDWYGKLTRANLNSLARIEKAIAALQALDCPASEDPAIVRIRELERGLIGRDIRGYFPTPQPICERMVRLARLEDGMRVWEPGAGKGSIAEVIRETARVQLDVCELQAELRQILELKGFNVIGFNCFDVTGEYDRILMNPPFGKGLEISHITHAYNRLADGGRLVTIAPESVNFRKDRAYREFRDWLADRTVLDEALPEGAFLESDRPTGVRTRLLVLEK